MSKLVNRIFKHKKPSKTLDDIQHASSSERRDSKNSTLPRSKTTQLTLANGHSNGHSTNHQDHQRLSLSPSGMVNSVSNDFSSIRSPEIRQPSPAGECMSPVEIPVEEALQMIAEDPPHVARSTPKGLVVDSVKDTKRWKEEHDMQHCIYERAVYEKMIDNSLKTCELLQNHLDSYITVVRQTPSREATPVKSGEVEKRKT